LVGVVTVFTVLMVPASAFGVSPVKEHTEFTGFGDIPAGIGCTFPFSFNPVEPYKGTYLTFTDQDGNPIRVATISKISHWTITNLDTGASHTFRISAGSEMDTPHPDGSYNFVLRGGWFVFNDSTGTPPGPWALVGSGQAHGSVSAEGVLTLSRVRGTTFDPCATVAS
jgi:hypothetical protein